jgi:glycosyltransferase involved in cell wall biosynthesis
VKIVFVSDAVYPYFKGGKEKRLYELTTRLSRLGNDVHIYTMHWWPGPEAGRTEDGVILHELSKLYPLYKGNKRSIVEGIMFGFACLKLTRVKWDVLDVDHMPFFPIYFAWIACLLTGRLRSFHGTWHEALTLRDWTTYMGGAGVVAAVVERISIQLPHAVTAASAHTGRLITSQLHRRRRVSVVPSGVDTTLLAHLRPAAEACDVLYVGRFVKDKNIDKLIAAIGIVAKSRPDVRCMIVGHGIEESALRAQIVTLHLTKNVSLHPPLPGAEDVYRAMKAARVFCLPSMREGFGIVALESLACGTPVVTTDSPANAAKDLITRPELGATVPLLPSELALAIETILSQPKAPQIANDIAAYDWSQIARKQAEVYGA